MVSFDIAVVAVGAAVQIAGVWFAVRAAAAAHTAQGAVAWVMALVLLPWVALPLYMLFGPPRLDRRASGLMAARAAALEAARIDRLPVAGASDERERRRRIALERLAPTPTLDGAPIELLVDGEAVFGAAFRDLDAADGYALVQFYIFRDDDFGRAFAAKLIERARAGVKVRVLYDEVGSRNVGRRWLRELEAGGVEVRPFTLGRKVPKAMQLNFRNHRKVVAVDGRSAVTGGPNVADEYLGRSKAFGAWRDTGVRLTGAAVGVVEASFLEDWILAGGESFDLSAPEAAPGGVPTLILLTGPAETLAGGSLMFCHLIGEARERLWIASPYFVPDLDVMTALKVAALRGVDVRVLIPARPDHLVVWLAAFAYVREAHAAGVQLWTYGDGFMHQKVMLIDDWAACVGTANLDNRSLRLNFELTTIGFDPTFAAAVAAMLEADFSRSRPYGPDEHRERGLLVRVFAPVARLFAPLL